MALFPVYMELKGKKCVVAGGGNVAARKAETLLDFEADVSVVSPEFTERLRELEKDGKIKIMRRKYKEEDLDGAFLAIAATSDRLVNETICSDAKARNIPVNVADSQEDCTFSFPAVVKRGELVIGISTSGGFPSLSKRLKQKIEEAIPGDYGIILEKLKIYREKAEVAIPDRNARKQAFENIIQEILLCIDEKDVQELDNRIEEITKKFID